MPWKQDIVLFSRRFFSVVSDSSLPAVVDKFLTVSSISAVQTFVSHATVLKNLLCVLKSRNAVTKIFPVATCFGISVSSTIFAYELFPGCFRHLPTLSPALSLPYGGVTGASPRRRGSGQGDKAEKVTLRAVAFLERLDLEARGRLPPPPFLITNDHDFIAYFIFLEKRKVQFDLLQTKNCPPLKTLISQCTNRNDIHAVISAVGVFSDSGEHHEERRLFHFCCIDFCAKFPQICRAFFY